ncbi:MAG: Zn-dependent hydrolase [Crocinitomicaceae bacterium]|nr:Zn-dependent hydrolase [Crocinitomicaceae bacterium]
MKKHFSYYSDPRRIEMAVKTLASFTEPDRPFTRLVFSPEFKQARQWLEAEFTKAGLNCYVDQGGNLIGLRQAVEDTSEQKKVIIGSHIDTVSAGGQFDGVAGIVAALEVIHFLNKQNIDLPFSIEIVDFLGEELNVWGLSCLGSRHMAGLLTDEMLLRIDQEGRLLGPQIESIGGNRQPPKAPRQDADTIIACLELHIEQADRLETNKTDIGIVTDIPGIRRYAIKVIGRAGHSGTTRMPERRDALVAASEVITTAQDTAITIAEQDNKHFVATIGRIDVYPNGAATVPGEVNMVLDLRASHEHSRNEFLKQLQARCMRISKNRSCKIEMELISNASGAVMDNELRKRLLHAANSLNLSHIDLSSGAGHDMVHLSRIAPAAMIFIPCKEGLSHCPEEFATPEAIAKGSAVLARTILALASDELYE